MLHRRVFWASPSPSCPVSTMAPSIGDHPAVTTLNLPEFGTNDLIAHRRLSSLTHVTGLRRWLNERSASETGRICLSKFVTRHAQQFSVGVARFVGVAAIPREKTLLTRTSRRPASDRHPL